MNEVRIAVLVGSLRKESFNRRLAAAWPRLAAGATFHPLRIDDLPPYNQDDDANPPAAAVRLKSAIVESWAGRSDSDGSMSDATVRPRYRDAICPP